ncbi:MAG: hypothetical protein GXO39_07970 [Thermotogae bacterium]|nr:hypothetical protein [Thermotogota bacterium]
MHPAVVLYIAIKRRESGKFQFVPAGGPDAFGVVKIALKDGDIVGFDSTWGTSLENLRRIFRWKKAIIQKLNDDGLVGTHMPRLEAMRKLINLEMEEILPSIHGLNLQDAENLIRIRVGKSKDLSPDEVKELKEKGFEGKTMFLQVGNKWASIIIAGKELYSFEITSKGVRRINFLDFPERRTRSVVSDHMVGLAVATPLFGKAMDIDYRTAEKEVERLKRSPDTIWHMILSDVGGIMVSAVGYRGLILGVSVARGDSVLLKDERYLKTVLTTLKPTKGRLYEYGKDMRSA